MTKLCMKVLPKTSDAQKPIHCFQFWVSLSGGPRFYASFAIAGPVGEYDNSSHIVFDDATDS